MKTTKTKGNFHQILAPLLFLLPNILIFTTFIIIPLFRGLSMSFMDWGVFTSPKFVGLKNFRLLFQDQVFIITLQNTIVYSLCVVLLLLVVSLLLALALSKNSIKGERMFRAVFYVPSLISMVAVGISWRFILGDEMGILNYLIRSLGGSVVPWLTNGPMAMMSVIVVTVWAGAGYYMVIFISGLQAIPLELYEAATIDGANRWQEFWRITLPLLKSTVLVVIVLSTIASFKAYELIVTMTKGGPGYSTKFIVQQVYEVAFTEDRMGYASAMSIVLMMIIGAFTLMQFRLSGKEAQYD